MIRKFMTAVISLALIAGLTGCNEPSNASSSESETMTAQVTEERPRDIIFDESSGFSLETNGEAFTNEELITIARKRYIAYTGYVPDYVQVIKEDGDIVYIGFYYSDIDGSIDTRYADDIYRVDRQTGVGYDKNNFRIDLTGYV